MNEDELRALIRSAIETHLGAATTASASARAMPAERRRDDQPMSIAFGQYQLAAGDTSCLIEPSVGCNHCGFCKCHGH
jgi:hypothetical protein